MIRFGRQIAAYLEQEMGFKNVTRLEGGIVSYSKFAKERGLQSKFKVFHARGPAEGNHTGPFLGCSHFSRGKTLTV